MKGDRIMIDTPATIDESGGLDLSHPLNQQLCEGFRWDGSHCPHAAKHWTHVVPGTSRRMALCGVHYAMLERRRRENYTGNGLLYLWRGHAAGEPQ